MVNILTIDKVKDIIDENLFELKNTIIDQTYRIKELEIVLKDKHETKIDLQNEIDRLKDRNKSLIKECNELSTIIGINKGDFSKYMCAKCNRFCNLNNN